MSALRVGLTNHLTWSYVSPFVSQSGIGGAGTLGRVAHLCCRQPISSETRDGKKVDVFYFKQGYSKVNKASRVAFHTAADVLTAGLWEVVATPGEALFNGKQVAFEVDYDQDEKIEKVVTLQQ